MNDCMLTLYQNLMCYNPSYIGRKDILVSCGKILKITDPGITSENPLIENTVDCSGLLAFPGFIDQHLHMLGAGGEEGFESRTGEIAFSEIVSAGVTTAVGLLGADGHARHLEGLYAKAKELESRGITTYIYSGSYEIPPVTLTGSLVKDLILVDKVIGAGEIAVSDHRSSQPELTDLLSVFSKAHIGGLLGGKAGVVHLHIGDGKGGLGIVREAIEKSDLPASMFVPTHLNRSESLFEQAVSLCKSGGNIDLTAGEKTGIPVPEAVRMLVKRGVDLSRVTVSSDGNGSDPGGGTTKILSLYRDIRECILNLGLSPGDAVRLVTENAAKRLKLFPKKGTLSEGSDADILITDKNYNIKKLISMGKLIQINA